MIPSLVFRSILLLNSSASFFLSRREIPLAGEYQSKQYHVARIRSSCHGKRAQAKLSLGEDSRSSPNLSRAKLSFSTEKVKEKKIWRMYTATSKGVAQPDNKLELSKYHVRQLKWI